MFSRKTLVKNLSNLSLDLVTILARTTTPHLALDDGGKGDSLVEIEFLGCKFVNQAITLNLLIHMSEGCLESRLWTLISWHGIGISKNIALERGTCWLIGKEWAVIRLGECSFDRLLTVASPFECRGGVLALWLITRIDDSATWQECDNAIIMTPLRELRRDLRQRLRRAKLTYASMQLITRA